MGGLGVAADTELNFQELMVILMSKNLLAETLIEKFRNTVNRKDFVLFKYQDANGKNHWHAICSCMDWITVAVRSINLLGMLPKDIDMKVMHIYSLISYIDILNESITTLHSVLVLNGRRHESPFKNDKSIFGGEEEKDDNEYFTELRARFGAHPVNLQDKKSKERHFASWPYDSWDNCDLQVTLYSNLTEGKDKIIRLKVEDLLRFLKLRYEYLKFLINEINSQYQNFISIQKTKKIQKNSDITKQIDILIIESKSRLNFDYIDYMLREIRDLFTTSVPDEKFSEREKSFKKDLEKLLENIYNHLQYCDFENEIQFHDLLTPSNLYKIDNYVMGKVMSFLLSNDRKDSLIDYYFRRLNEIDRWGYKFAEYEDRKLTLLKIHLMNREAFSHIDSRNSGLPLKFQKINSDATKS